MKRAFVFLVLAPFLRSDATIETLQKATGALEEVLKERGYALHRVVLPPQEVGDTVRLTIVKFVIGKVNIEGLQRYDEANIRASLPELKEGEAPNFKTLAVQTAIANESQGKQVQIVQPSKSDKHHLYRARLLNFTPQEAQGACAALRKKKLECALLSPPALKIANR